MTADPWAWTETLGRTDRPAPRCPGCGYPVARAGMYCAECTCEEDGP